VDDGHSSKSSSTAVGGEETMNDIAYVRGVLDGDGFVDMYHPNPRLGLETISKGFAEAFSGALNKIGYIPRLSERDRTRTSNGYTWSWHSYQIRATCNNFFMEELMNLNVLPEENKLSYLIGFFQSEGCFRIHKYPKRECWIWHITNKDLTRLKIIQSILNSFGIKSGLITKKDGISMLYVQRRIDITKLLELGVKKK